MNGCTVSFLLYDFIDTAILINGIDRTQNIVTAMASNDNSIVGAVQTLYGTWIKWFSFGKCLSCINPMHTRITQRAESLGRCCSNVSQRLFRWNFLTAIRRKSRCHYIGWLFIVFFSLRFHTPNMISTLNFCMRIWLRFQSGWNTKIQHIPYCSDKFTHSEPFFRILENRWFKPR